MIPLLRLQNYLYDKAEDPYFNLTMLLPFVAYQHIRNSDLYHNYAVPIHQISGDISEELRQLSIHFMANDKNPAVRFFDGLYPTLGIKLGKLGYTLHEQKSIMICSPQMFSPPPPMVNLQIVPLSLQSSVEEVKEMLDTEARSQDSMATLATEFEAVEFRSNLGAQQAFSLRLDGQGVAAVMYEQIRDNITEIKGVSTVSAYRGRGIGSIATAHATRTAFQSGAEAVFVQIGDTRTVNLFRRLGYRHTTNTCLYSKG